MSAKEADALMRSAKKHVEKSLLKWTSNHGAAAEDYEKAAKIYTHLKLKDRAIEAFTKASHEHAEAKNAYFAGRCLETLALYLAEDTQRVYEEAEAGGKATSTTQNAAVDCLNGLRTAASYYSRAAQIYFEDNKLSNQSDAMNKASQLFTELMKKENRKLPPRRNDAVLRQAQAEFRRYASESLTALELNWEVNEASPHKLPEVYRALVLTAIRGNDLFSAIQTQKRMLGVVAEAGGEGGGGGGGGGGGFSVDSERYDDSKNLFKRLGQPHNAAKTALEVVVLILAFNADYIWASKEMEWLTRVDGFKGSPEESCARQLIQCFEDRDADALADAIKSNSGVLNFLLSDVSRMARKLTMVVSAGTAPAVGVAVVKEVSRPSTPVQQPQQESHDRSESEEVIDAEEDLR